MKLFNLKIMLYSDYEVLQGEWEKQNADIDHMRAEKNQLKKEIEKLQKKQETSEKVISTYEETVANKNKALAEKDAIIEKKEVARKSNASKIGGYTKENHKLRAKIEEQYLKIKELEQQVQDLTAAKQKLEGTNEFLKSHRRAPDIEELKDYTLNRKGRRKGFKKAS